MYIDLDPPLDDPLRTEEFDALVRELLPEVRTRAPQLSVIDALREAARLAEARLRSDGRLDRGRI
jgi:hypothetical protein